MIDVKTAAQKAILYFDDLMKPKIKDIWLEEVELSNDEKVWNVTLSALAPERKQSSVTSDLTAIAAVFGPVKEERLYKLFSVDAETGDVKGMKIRKRPE